MKSIIGSVGGVISGCLIGLGIIADAHNTSTLAITLMGQHSPEEWNQIISGFIYSGITGIIITVVILIILSFLHL